MVHLQMAGQSGIGTQTFLSLNFFSKDLVKYMFVRCLKCNELGQINVAALKKSSSFLPLIGNQPIIDVQIGRQRIYQFFPSLLSSSKTHQQLKDDSLLCTNYKKFHILHVIFF